MLDVFHDDGWNAFRLERVPDKAGRWVEASAVGRANMNAEAPVTFSLDPQEAAPSPSDTFELPVEVNRHHNIPSGCSEFTYLSPVFPPESVATSAVINGIQAKFTYTSSAKTVAGLGVSYNAGATWSANGSAERTSGITAGFSTITGATGSWTKKEWRANWEHRRYWRHCVGGPNGAPWHEQRYTEPVKVSGFPAIINSRYSLPPCVNQQPLTGTSWVETDDAIATTYGAAFSITWGAGTFSGSARSGYTTAVKYRFERPGSGYWYWCGNTSNPLDSAWVRVGR